MKKLFTLVAALLFAATVWAQSSSPKMSYQAVVRNAANELVVNRTDLTVEVSIKQADTVAFKETHTNVKTNQNGLLSLLIGDGNVNKGSLNDVDWKNAKIATSINLGEGEPVSATVPVTAVPYALYAESVNPNSEIINNIYEKLYDTLNAYYDTTKIKNLLENYEIKTCEDVTNCVSEALTGDESEINDIIDSIADAHIKQAAVDSLISARELTDSLKNYEIKTCEDVTACVNTALSDASSTTNDLVDSIVDEHIKLADSLATKTYVDSALSSYVTTESLNTTLGNYYTKSETYSQIQVNEKFEDYYTSDKIDDTLANYALISQEKALTIKSLSTADSTKLLNDTTLTIPEGFILDTDHLIKLYINGVYVGDTDDQVLTVNATTKKVHYDPAKNGDYKLKEGDRIKILYWVKNN